MQSEFGFVDGIPFIPGGRLQASDTPASGLGRQTPSSPSSRRLPSLYRLLWLPPSQEVRELGLPVLNAICCPTCPHSGST